MNEIALSMIVAVFALGCIGLVVLYYRRKMRCFKGRFNIDDIALIKDCRSCLNALWDKHRPDSKVIYLDDWRE